MLFKPQYRIIENYSVNCSQYRAQKRSRFGWWYTLHNGYTTELYGYSSTEENARRIIEDYRSRETKVTIIE